MAKMSCKPRLTFSAEDDRALIDIVSKYEIIWKFSHPDFKNNLKKEKVWIGIGRKMGKTDVGPLNVSKCLVNTPERDGESCKKRWRNIRDHFGRKKETHTGAKRKKRAPYWQSLNFLNNEEDSRKAFTNVGAIENSNASMGTEEIEIWEEDDEDETKTEIKIENNLDEDDEDKTKTEIKIENNFESTNTEEDHLEKSEEEVNNFLTEPQSTWLPQYMLTNDRPVIKNQKKEQIVSLLQLRNADNEQLLDCVAELIQDNKPHENENDLFFRSMAVIVNKFDEKNQAIARRKVFAIVSSMEIAHYSALNTSHSSQS